MKSLIKIENIKKGYPVGDEKITVLDGLNFEVKSGEFIAIMGPSGSGKSTLLNILSGLERPDQGKIIIDKINIHKLSQDKSADFRREYIGYVFQQFHIIPTLTAKENIMLPTSLSKKKKNVEEKITNLLNKVGLLHRKDNLPSQLSGGEQQRVAIARALANEPVILIADEPTGNLDSKTSSQIMNLLKELNKKEKYTILMVTHDKNCASYADRIIKMIDGKIMKRR